VQIKDWQAQRRSLKEIRARLAEVDHLDAPSALSEQFLTRAITSDLRGALHAILDSQELGVPLSTLFGEVLAPALEAVGTGWERGEVLVAQEKEITELSRDVIAHLAWRYADPVFNGQTLIAACVEGERHELGLRMVCALLRGGGWRIHFLGVDVAAPILREAIRLHAPTAVLLSITTEAHRAALLSTLDDLQSASAEGSAVPVIVGGQAVAGLAEDIAAHHGIPVPETRPTQVFDAVVAALSSLTPAPIGIR
jgi:methanogenic corrinoid protein MtbC1